MSTRLDAITDWPTAAKLARYRCENIAAAYFISERHLERFFLIRFNESPKRWMQSHRMCLAGDLMKQGYSTKAAAEDLFYRGASQFCREFKKYFGRSPQNFGCKSDCRKKSTMSDFANQLELNAFNPKFKIPASKQRNAKR